MKNENIAIIVGIITAIVVALFILSGCSIPNQITPLKNESNFSTESILIGSWNLQIFGDKKANNETLLNKYVDIINDYDIIFLQEIRDADGSAPQVLIDRLPEYNCKLSSRAGSTTMKEQYLLCYKKYLTLTSFEDYNPQLSDQFERPPIRTEINNITIYGIHIDPDKVETEMKALEQIAIPDKLTIVTGDLNYDCSYLPEGLVTFQEWQWSTGDTTSGNTVCSYDRFITNFPIIGHIRQTPKELSDHYLIWTEVKR